MKICGVKIRDVESEICGVKIRNDLKPKPKFNLDGVWEWQEYIRGLAQNHVYYGKEEIKATSIQ